MTAQSLTKGTMVEERPIRVLLIEANPEDVLVIEEMLARTHAARFELECVDRLAAGLVRLAANNIGVVLLDLNLPDSQGFDTFVKAHAQAPKMPIVVMSNRADEDLAIKTVQEGAQDYLVKGQINSDLLVRAIRSAVERKRAEETLRAQALIFENIHDGIVMTDLEGNIIRWNPAAERIFGYYKDEVFRKTLGTLTTKIIKGQLRDDRWAGEMGFTRKDGTEGICETIVIPLRDEYGTISAVLGVSHDITDHKQTEESLRKSEEKYRSIIENMQEGYFENDLAGNFIFFNDALCRIIGYPREELIGKNNRQYTDEKTAKKIYQVYNRIYRTGEPSKGIEEEYIRKDGTKLFAELSVSLISDAEGKPIGFRGIARDVTERKRAEEALQRSYHQLRESLITTVNTLASTIELRDPYTAGHQRRVTILACAIAEEMGLAKEQFDGLRLAGLVHDIGKFTVPVEILNKPGRITETEFNIIKTHAEAGYNVLKEIEFPWPVARIVLQHHERLDGSGYPQRLKDAGIMPEAKILAVADVVEAMASHRPYRPALGIEAALHEISMNKGILYDPDATDICLRLFTKKGFALKQEL